MPIIGGLGTVSGVEDTTLLGALCPTEFIATTSKLYRDPFTSPVTVACVEVDPVSNTLQVNAVESL